MPQPIYEIIVNSFCGDVDFFIGYFFNSIFLSFFIFFMGAFGIVFNRKNILLLMVSIEIMFLGISFIFIFTFVFFGEPLGLIYSLVILSLAAAEAAVGFGLLIGSFNLVPNITFNRFNRLRG
jgi:NADH:ubiquinone oxidoreductase subunit K